MAEDLERLRRNWEENKICELWDELRDLKARVKVLEETRILEKAVARSR